MVPRKDPLEELGGFEVGNNTFSRAVTTNRTIPRYVAIAPKKSTSKPSPEVRVSSILRKVRPKASRNSIGTNRQPVLGKPSAPFGSTMLQTSISDLPYANIPRYCIAQTFPLSKLKTPTSDPQFDPLSTLSSGAPHETLLPNSTLDNSPSMPHAIVIQKDPLGASSSTLGTVVLQKGTPLGQNLLFGSTLDNSPKKPHAIVIQKDPLGASSSTSGSVVLQKGTPLGTGQQNLLFGSTLDNSPKKPHAVVIQKDPLGASSSTPGSVVLQKGTPLGTGQQNLLFGSTLDHSPTKPHAIVIQKDPLGASSSTPGTVVLQKGTPLGAVPQYFSLGSTLDNSNTVAIQKDPLAASSSTPGTAQQDFLLSSTLNSPPSEPHATVFQKNHLAASALPPSTARLQEDVPLGAVKSNASLSSTLPSFSRPRSIAPKNDPSAPTIGFEKGTALGAVSSTHHNPLSSNDLTSYPRQASLPDAMSSTSNSVPPGQDLAIPRKSVEKNDSVLRKSGLDSTRVDSSTARCPPLESESNKARVYYPYDDRNVLVAKKMKDRDGYIVEYQYVDPFDYVHLTKVPSPPAKSTEKEKEKDHQWQCLMCYLIMENKSELIQHYEGHKRVRDSLPSNDVIIKQEEKEKLIKCPSCREVCKNHTEYDRHVKLKHPNMNGPKCKKCRLYCDTYLALSLHIEFEHGGKQGEFKCCLCGCSMWSKDLLEDHMTDVHEDKTYDCTTCNMVSTRSVN
ncbi:unnamed protein product [Acanthoscelides obtectus]|uniref:C2H2-type domain-containing protein n=1 Tax=Acanthoscelides obtectus TaxID=200917 RepID=A0A9P0KMJ1_ACAOB|nr:unnamed protein product [Acanthoscelides obtectus]CAK1675599.1 hypothetical protein AOBTE_LOCUS30314 [Acanthoscelides obtectus]